MTTEEAVRGMRLYCLITSVAITEEGELERQRRIKELLEGSK